MSYIIAFVQFGESREEYPVNCFRTDLRINDSVLVRGADKRLSEARVNKIKYLNWDCSSFIECKCSEASTDDRGLTILPKKTPIVEGLSTQDSVISEIIKNGWVPLKPSNKSYRAVLAFDNETGSANIWFRKNGVDLQLLQERREIDLRAYSECTSAIAEGTVVRHYLSQTTFNLYEGVERFSNSFLLNEGDYTRFFKPVGSRNKSSSDLKKRKTSSGGLRSALEGCEDSDGRIYLGDGIYI